MGVIVRIAKVGALVCGLVACGGEIVSNSECPGSSSPSTCVVHLVDASSPDATGGGTGCAPGTMSSDSGCHTLSDGSEGESVDAPGHVDVADGGTIDAGGADGSGSPDAAVVTWPDAGIDVTTACLGDANVFVVAGEDGYVHSGPPTIVAVTSATGQGGLQEPGGGSGSVVAIDTDAGWSIEFEGTVYGAPLAVGDYTNAVAGAYPWQPYMMMFYMPANEGNQSSYGSEFDITQLEYNATTQSPGSWTITAFTATYTFFITADGPPDVGCVHYQR